MFLRRNPKNLRDSRDLKDLNDAAQREEEKMKQIFVFFCCLTAMFLMIGCGEGATAVSGSEAGSLGKECYPNKTCNSGLTCDEESNLCVEDSENPTNPTDEPTDEPTNPTTDPASGDDADTSEPEPNDNDTNTADDSEITDENNTTPDENSNDSDAPVVNDPCNPNPCAGIANSTGICSQDSGKYVCGCKPNYNWDGTFCRAATKNAPCEPKPANTVWNDVNGDGTFTQTWNGESWVPTSYPSSFNKTPGICTFKCAGGYSWNGTSCDAAPSTVSNCTGLPENAVWNTTPTIVQTFDGSSWEPSTVGEYNLTPSATECRFICKPNYNWNGSQCLAATQEVECTGLPEYAEWNTATSITQTWSGEEWLPSASGYYSTSGSSNECRFKCKVNYNWSDGTCVAKTRTASCTDLPFGAQWNAVSSITQTWNGSDWVPSNESTFNLTQSSKECRFKCKENYTWNATQAECLADTQFTSCINLPTGAKWNQYDKVTQTWDGSSWQPAPTGVYNETPSQTQCRYICDTHYQWNGSKCVADTQTAACTGLPEYAEWNTATSITQTWNGSSWQPSETGSYSSSASTSECKFKCGTNFNWNGSQCVGNTQTAGCTGLPAHASWNTASTITQTWNGSAWLPTTIGNYSETSSTSECLFGCNLNYTWDGTACNPDTQTAVCTGLPEGATWNTATTITQTWNGTSWQPSETGSYSTTSSMSECRYKCKEHYTWKNSQCTADTQTAACTDLPVNAQWNSVSSITQTWNGSIWTPTTVGSYNANASSSECRFKCKEHYTWKNSQCTADTQTANCSELPANAEWNSVSSITQTWNGSEWTPTTDGTYSTIASTSECRYKCKPEYHWANSECISDIKRSNCTGLPANAVWNSVSSIDQTWNGSTWIPTTTGVFNADPSTEECRFKCNVNYSWKNQTCTADSRVVNCEGKPANTVWNTAETISQTWDGSAWQPANTGSYDETESTSECRYKCDADHFRHNSQCVSECDNDPCENMEGSTGNCIATAWNEYVCECDSSHSRDDSGGCGLQWSDRSSNKMSWADANTYCASLTEGGFTDWRLPNINELRTLIQNCAGTVTGGSCPVKDPGCLSSSCYNSKTCSCSEDLSGKYSKFGETDAFWSSSTSSVDTDYAWYVYFSAGGVSYTNKSYNNYVRCVR